MDKQRRRIAERGNLLLVVVFLATAIAGLAAITSGRVVSETRQQTALEQQTRAFNSAYAQLHMAMNVVNGSPYDDQNHNLVLRAAINGDNGGTVENALRIAWREKVAASKGTQLPEDGKLAAGEKSGYQAEDVFAKSTAGDTWLNHPEDPGYGFVRGTNVRVYRGRDYLKRIARLKGEPVADIDPSGASDNYFILEAAGRSGDTIRLVAALVRENEPFSSFVFFQNRATLGVSGAPRGLIHSNEKLAFYFPNGSYVDAVGAVSGFEFQAGATPANTNIRDGNPEAAPISLEKIDFAELKSKANLYLGEAGLDAEVKMYGSGKVRIRPHTPPRYEQVEKSYTYQKYVGRETVTSTVLKDVKVGENEVTYEVQEIDRYETETYTESERVQTGETTERYIEQRKVKVGETTETKYRTVRVQTGTETVTKTRYEPIFEDQVVTKTRRVKVWQSYNEGGAEGGTTVGGGASGELGEWVWVDEEYQTTERVQVGTKAVEYTVEEPVYENQQQPFTVTTPIFEMRDVEKTRTVPIYEMQDVEKTRQVPVYKTVTKTKLEPIYEQREVEVTKTVNVYEDVTVTYMVWEFHYPKYMPNQFVWLSDDSNGTMYVDGRVTRLYGDLNGRLSLVSSDNVRITGNIRYVDGNGNTAMKNGSDYTKPYHRNPEYKGNSVLGVIAAEDILFTRYLPRQAEINGTLMAVNGRVGIDGFWADVNGELHKDNRSSRRTYLSYEDQVREAAYDRISAYRTRTYRKDSLRRIGGVISNNRIMETYVKADKYGYAQVDSGFKRGNAKFDINLLFNPPPNFVEVPRPVLTTFMPIVLAHNNG